MGEVSWVKKLLLVYLFTGFSVASHAATIKVTTIADQNGEDASNCSLREAVYASLAKESFGGCESNDLNHSDTIVLEAKTYQLDMGEIPVFLRNAKFGKAITIQGPNELDYLKRDSITGTIGKRPDAPQTTIVAASGARVFNSTKDAVGLSLSHIKLKSLGAISGNGGAFLVGGNLNLENVVIDGFGANQGGAIYLEGSNSRLTASRSVFTNLQSQSDGAVLAEACFDNLTFAQRKIEFLNSSIVNSTSTGATGSVIKFCGAPDVTFNNTTIANNTAQADGSLVDFSGVQVFEAGGKIVSPSLSFEHVSAINNTHGLRYTELGSIAVKNSVLAFNDTYDCQYVGKEELSNTYNFSALNTLFKGSNTSLETNACQRSQPSGRNNAAEPDTTNDYTTSSLSDYFEAGLKNYGFGLLGYLPKRFSSQNLLKTYKSNACGVSDKRGIARSQFDSVDQNQAIGCYKGSLERGSLLAIDDELATNTSYTHIVDKLQSRIDSKTPSEASEKQKAIDADYRDQQSAMLQAYKSAMKNRFRGVTIDVLVNDIPYEDAASPTPNIKLFPLLRRLSTNNGYVIDDDSNYTITAKGIGRASELIFDSNGKPQTQTDDAFKCVFDENLNQIVAWRTDGNVTQTGEQNFCQYTVSLKSDTSINSTAYVPVQIGNIAPNAEGFDISTEGDETWVDIDLSEHINDDGDGLNRPASMPEFYRYNGEIDAYVEIVKEPVLGRLVFENEGVRCPNPNSSQVSTKMCYTGKFRYKRHRAGAVASDFNDSFTYRVFDSGVNADGSISGVAVSSEAKVNILARRNTGPATPILSGGGALNMGLLVFLSLLFGVSSVLIRLQKIPKESIK